MTQIKVPYTNFGIEFENQRAELMPAIERVFEVGDFILGEEVSRFESRFKELCGVRHAISVANGTDAIILALKSLGIGPGDEVITAANSWISSTASIALVGATPVFADVDDDQNISPDAIERKISSKTKAILPIHLTGRCARMREIMNLASRHRLSVIEDAAQAVMARVGDNFSGSLGTVGCFSLHPLKNLNAAGDAGILTTNDDFLAQKLRGLRAHGLKNRDEVAFWGFNSRLDTIQAAILNVRIGKLDQLIETKVKNARFYTRELSKMVQCPSDDSERPHTYHVYVIQTDRRNELHDFLCSRGIETKIHYPIPIHLQEAARYLGYELGSLPVTERQANRILSLPCNPYLSKDQMNWVVESIRTFFGYSA